MSFQWMLLWGSVCFVHGLYAQLVSKHQDLSSFRFVVQSVCVLSGDTVRAAGVNAQGWVEWADFKTNYKMRVLLDTHWVKNMDFRAITLQILSKNEILVAGKQSKDSLLWAIYDIEKQQMVQRCVLPDSLSKMQLRVVRRLRTGEVILGGNREEAMMFVRTDSHGRVKRVLYQAKQLKEDMLDVFVEKDSLLYAVGYMKDDIFENCLIYMLKLNKDFKIQSFKLVGNNDSLNVGHAIGLSELQTPVLIGTTGNQLLLTNLDPQNQVQDELLLDSLKRWKHLYLEVLTPPRFGTKYRIWATDVYHHLHIYWIKYEK